MARPDLVATTEPTLSDLAAQIATLRDDLATLSATAGAYGKAKGEAAVEGARTRARAAAAKGHEQMDAVTAQMADLGAEFASEADNFVRNRPATALGIAAGAGFLIGLLTSRR